MAYQRRAIAFLLLALAAIYDARAQITYSLVSDKLRVGDAAVLRIDSVQGCISVPTIETARSSSAVTAMLRGTDGGPCLPAWATPRFVDLGVFEAGTFETRVLLCGNPPPPEPACQLQATLPLTVFGVAGRRHTVPAISGPCAALLVTCVIAMGLAAIRTRGS